MNNLSQRLKILREKKKLTVTQVAKKLGVSPSTYREWEYGRKIMGEPYIKLAEIFEVSLINLMMGREHDVETELIRIEKCIRNIRSYL